MSSTSAHRWFASEAVPAQFSGVAAAEQMRDEAVKEAFGKPTPGERRTALLELLQLRMESTRRDLLQQLELAGVDKDAIATRLVAKLEALGDGGVWEAFRIIGETQASLVGKKSQPRGAKAGMDAVRAGGEADGEVIRGEREVLAELQRLSRDSYKERGGSVAALEALLTATSATPREPEPPPQAAAGGSEGRSLEEEVEAMLPEASFLAALKTWREDMGVGKGGWPAYELALAPREVQLLYLQGLREVAVDILTAQGDAETRTQAEARRGVAATRATAPADWLEWIAVLLPKPGEDPTLFHRRRDIWLQPHGLKLLMLTLRPDYDLAARRKVPHSQSGFAGDRDAPEDTITLGLHREMTATQRRTSCRGFCDFATFFESASRDVTRAVEKAMKVRPSTTRVVLALQDAVRRRIDSGDGLTAGVDSECGLGQGDVASPARSKLLLAVMQDAIEALCDGAKADVPYGCEADAIGDVFFADDGAFEADSVAGLQLMFDVAWTVARIMGLTIGVNEKGTKTAWSGGEWRRSGSGPPAWHPLRGVQQIRLPDKRVVPFVDSYKHLGTLMEATLNFGATRERVAQRCRSLLGMLARLGVLSAVQYERAARAVVDSLIGYYGRSTPIDDATCERIEVARRCALQALGHWPKGTPTNVVYATDGGLGCSHAQAAAAAALHDEFDRVLNAPEGRPSRVAMESAVLHTFWRLGYRPTRAAPSPLDWRPWHLLEQGALSEDLIVEAWLRNCLRHGLLPNSTSAESKGALGAELKMATDEAAAQSLWEQKGRTFSRRLAAAGIVERSTIAGLGQPMTWPQAQEAWKLPDTVSMSAEYERLLREIRADRQDWAWYEARQQTSAEGDYVSQRVEHVLAARDRASGWAPEYLVVREGETAAEATWQTQRGWSRSAQAEAAVAASAKQAGDFREWLERRAAQGASVAGEADAWLHLATEVDMAGEGEQAADARAVAAQLVDELQLYAERVRWPRAPVRERSGGPPLGAAADRARMQEAPEARPQRFFLGTLVDTDEVRDDGRARRRCKPSMAAHRVGQQRGAVLTQSEMLGSDARETWPISWSDEQGQPQRLWAAAATVERRMGEGVEGGAGAELSDSDTEEGRQQQQQRRQQHERQQQQPRSVEVPWVAGVGRAAPPPPPLGGEAEVVPSSCKSACRSASAPLLLASDWPPTAAEWLPSAASSSSSSASSNPASTIPSPPAKITPVPPVPPPHELWAPH